MEWIEPLNQEHSLWAFCLFYWILCLPIAGLMALALTHSRYNTRRLSFLLFYSLCVSMVGMGVLIACVVCFLIRTQKIIKKKKAYMISAQVPDYQKAPRSKSIIYGESSAIQKMKNQRGSKSDRELMLLAVNQYESPVRNKINSMALSDDVDEIRLYAQGFIEKQEREITRRLKDLNAILKQSLDVVKTATCKKRIAELLWEQVYKYLVIQENLLPTLTKIETYAIEALTELPTDAELPLLLTRVALRMNDPVKANRWLNTAIKNQSPKHKVAPLLAEVAYIEKKYNAIPELFSQSPCQNIIGLKPILSFWRQDD